MCYIKRTTDVLMTLAEIRLDMAGGNAYNPLAFGRIFSVGVPAEERIRIFDRYWLAWLIINKGAVECPGSSGVEQRTENPRVGGSNPPPGTIKNRDLAES